MRNTKTCIFVLSILLFSGFATADIEVDSLDFEEVDEEFKEDEIHFETSYLNKTLDPEQVFVPEELNDSVEDLSYDLVEWNESEGAVINYNLQYKQEFNTDYPTEDLKAVLGNDDEADSDYPANYHQMDDSTEAESNEEEDRVFNFEIVDEEDEYNVYWEVQVESHYEHLIINYELIYDEEEDEPDIVHTFEDVYSGEDPEKVTIEAESEQTSYNTSKQTVEYDNLYGEEKNIIVQGIKEPDAELIEKDFNNLEYEQIDIDYEEDVKTPLQEANINEDLIIDTQTLFEEHEHNTYNITIPEDSKQKFELHYEYFRNPDILGVQPANEFQTYVIGSGGAIEVASDDEWENGTFIDSESDRGGLTMEEQTATQDLSYSNTYDYGNLYTMIEVNEHIDSLYVPVRSSGNEHCEGVGIYEADFDAETRDDELMYYHDKSHDSCGGTVGSYNYYIRPDGGIPPGEYAIYLDKEYGNSEGVSMEYDGSNDPDNVIRNEGWTSSCTSDECGYADGGAGGLFEVEARYYYEDGFYESAEFERDVPSFFENVTIDLEREGDSEAHLIVETSNDGFETIENEDTISNFNLEDGLNTYDLAFDEPYENIRFEYEMHRGSVPEVESTEINYEEAAPVVENLEKQDEPEFNEDLTYTATLDDPQDLDIKDVTFLVERDGEIIHEETGEETENNEQWEYTLPIDTLDEEYTLTVSEATNEEDITNENIEENIKFEVPTLELQALEIPENISTPYNFPLDVECGINCEELNLTAQEVNYEEEEIEYNLGTSVERGATGMSQSEADDFYSGTNLEEEVEIIGEGIQRIELEPGNYAIRAEGARGADAGASYDPGSGAVMEAEFEIEEETHARIIVGQKGEPVTDSDGNAGGGGTFIVLESDSAEYEMFDGQNVEPLIIAGGGSGSWDNSPTDTLNARIDRWDEYQNEYTFEGGWDWGDGGSEEGAGGGFISHGECDGASRGCDPGGSSFLSGGEGGYSEESSSGEGGFGGGGAYGSFNYGSGGGGASGGDFCPYGDNDCDAGGGSYINDDYTVEVITEEKGGNHDVGDVHIEGFISELETQGDPFAENTIEEENESIEAVFEDYRDETPQQFEYNITVKAEDEDGNIIEEQDEGDIFELEEVEVIPPEVVEKDWNGDIENPEFEENISPVITSEDPDEQGIAEQQMIVEKEGEQVFNQTVQGEDVEDTAEFDEFVFEEMDTEYHVEFIIEDELGGTTEDTQIVEIPQIDFEVVDEDLGNVTTPERFNFTAETGREPQEATLQYREVGETDWNEESTNDIEDGKVQGIFSTFIDEEPIDVEYRFEHESLNEDGEVETGTSETREFTLEEVSAIPVLDDQDLEYDDLGYNPLIDEERVMLGHDFSNKHNVEQLVDITNNKEEDVAVIVEEVLDDRCDITGDIVSEVAGDSVEEVGVETECGVGEEVNRETVSKVEEDFDYRYDYEATVNVSTSAFNQKEIHYMIPRDRLDEWSARSPGEYDVSFNGNSDDISVDEEVVDDEEYVVLEVGTDHSTSSLSDGSYDVEFSYYESRDQTADGGLGGSEETDEVEEIDDEFNWRVSAFGGEQTEVFSVFGYPGRNFERNIQLENLGEEDVDLDLECVSDDNTCDWVELGVDSVELDSADFTETVVDVEVDIPEEADPDVDRNFEVMVTDPSYDPEDDDFQGMATVNFDIDMNPFAGRFIATLFKITEVQHISPPDFVDEDAEPIPMPNALPVLMSFVAVLVVGRWIIDDGRYFVSNSAVALGVSVIVLILV